MRTKRTRSPDHNFIFLPAWFVTHPFKPTVYFRDAGLLHWIAGLPPAPRRSVDVGSSEHARAATHLPFCAGYKRVCTAKAGFNRARSFARPVKILPTPLPSFPGGRQGAGVSGSFHGAQLAAPPHAWSGAWGSRNYSFRMIPMGVCWSSWPRGLSFKIRA